MEIGILLQTRAALLYHHEHDAGEYQGEDHDESQADSGATDRGCVLLQNGGGHVVASIVVDVIQIWVGDARFPLPAVDLLATTLRHLALPIAVVVHSATVQPGLRAVPGPRDVLSVAVQSDRGDHFLAHRLTDLFAEHESQDGTD